MTHPLIWEVVSTDKDKVYLITRNIVDCVPFCEEKPEYHSDIWTNSYIRKWLNEDFYNTAFSEDEKEKVLTVDQKILNFLLKI